MNCENIILMISEYLDGELIKEKEPLLFTHLSSCAECREEFKVQSAIQNQTKLNQKEVTARFEKKLFGEIEKSERNFSQKWITKPTPVYTNYFLGVIVAIISIFSFYQINSLRSDLNTFQQRYENSLQQINYQAVQMFNLMNSIPAVEVEQRTISMN